MLVKFGAMISKARQMLDKCGIMPLKLGIILVNQNIIVETWTKILYLNNLILKIELHYLFASGIFVFSVLVRKKKDASAELVLLNHSLYQTLPDLVRVIHL
jgi:hypothetical protein